MLKCTKLYTFLGVGSNSSLSVLNSLEDYAGILVYIGWGYSIWWLQWLEMVFEVVRVACNLNLLWVEGWQFRKLIKCCGHSLGVLPDFNKSFGLVARQLDFEGTKWDYETRFLANCVESLLQ